MVHSWVGTYVVQAAGGAGLKVCGSKYQGLYTGVYQGSCTHDAGLKGDHEVAVI